MNLCFLIQSRRPSFINITLLGLFTSVVPKTGAAPPSFRSGPTLLPPHRPSSLVLRLPLFFHHKKELPLQLSVCLLLQAVSEPHPDPVQDPCSVYAAWVAFLCTVCDQWCHGTHFTADYLWLALCCCPTCSTLVPPAAPTREAESTDMERTHSTLSSRDSLSKRRGSLSCDPWSSCVCLWAVFLFLCAGGV